MNNGLTNFVVVTTDEDYSELYCSDCASELFAGDSRRVIEPRYTWENNESDTPNHCPNCSVLLEEDMTEFGLDYIRQEVVTTLSSGETLGIDEDSTLGEWLDRWGDQISSSADLDSITDVEQVTAAYLAAQLWTGTLDYYTATPEFGGESLTADSTLDSVVTVEELPEEIKQEARQDVEQFLDAISPYLKFWDIPEELTAEQLGHDFSLTRNGHGAGFWDRGWGDLGLWLTRWAKSFSSSGIYGAVVMIDPESESLEKSNLDLSTLRIWSMG